MATLRPKASPWIHNFEKTVCALQKTGRIEESYDSLQGILARVRRQHDEVHLEAERREAELVFVRQDVTSIDLEAGPEDDSYRGFSREDIMSKMEETAAEMDAAMEAQRVYQHMAERVQREVRIVEQKVALLQAHLERKTRELAQRRSCSRKELHKKAATVLALEDLETEFEQEQQFCHSALADLEVSERMLREEAQHREEFERWRYEVALEAATKAFEATLGQYRKLFAIERLTGNYLQKIAFEEAERSQATEDGFQKIREVTGLSDVMDIVHKFLNRDHEHEQLKASAREAETRLHHLREAEVARGCSAEALAERPEEVPARSLGVELGECELALVRARQEQDELRRRVQRGALLLEGVIAWAQRIRESLAPVQRLEPVASRADVPPFFDALAQAVERFLEGNRAAVPEARLAKIVSQAPVRENAERQRLLADQEFTRLNCRVPATLEHRAAEELRWRQAAAAAGSLPAAFGLPLAAPPPPAGEEEGQRHRELNEERERLKLQAAGRAGEREPRAKPRGSVAQSPRASLGQGGR